MNKKMNFFKKIDSKSMKIMNNSMRNISKESIEREVFYNNLFDKYKKEDEILFAKHKVCLKDIVEKTIEDEFAENTFCKLTIPVFTSHLSPLNNLNGGFQSREYSNIIINDENENHENNNNNKLQVADDVADISTKSIEMLVTSKSQKIEVNQQFQNEEKLFKSNSTRPNKFIKKNLYLKPTVSHQNKIKEEKIDNLKLSLQGVYYKPNKKINQVFNFHNKDLSDLEELLPLSLSQTKKSKYNLKPSKSLNSFMTETKFNRYNIQHNSYLLSRDFSHKHKVNPSLPFLDRMMYYDIKSKVKHMKVAEEVEKVQPKISNSRSIEIVNHLLEDYNRREIVKKHIEENFLKIRDTLEGVIRPKSKGSWINFYNRTTKNETQKMVNMMGLINEKLKREKEKEIDKNLSNFTSKEKVKYETSKINEIVQRLSKERKVCEKNSDEENKFSSIKEYNKLKVNKDKRLITSEINESAEKSINKSKLKFKQIMETKDSKLIKNLKAKIPPSVKSKYMSKSSLYLNNTVNSEIIHANFTDETSAIEKTKEINIETEPKITEINKELKNDIKNNINDEKRKCINCKSNICIKIFRQKKSTDFSLNQTQNQTYSIKANRIKHKENLIKHKSPLTVKKEIKIVNEINDFKYLVGEFNKTKLPIQIQKIPTEQIPKQLHRPITNYHLRPSEKTNQKTKSIGGQTTKLNLNFPIITQNHLNYLSSIANS